MAERRGRASAAAVGEPPGARALRHPSFAIGGVLVAAAARDGRAVVGLDAASGDRDRHRRTAAAAERARTGSAPTASAATSPSLLIVGARNSIAVGIIAVGIGIAFGVALGLLASARRGWVEEAVMRLSDFTFAFPALLSAIMLTAIYGPGLYTSIVAIGIFNIPVFARITRAAANAIWSREYVLAARACGKGAWRITIEHVLPNIAALLIVQATIQFAIAILAEAALSYLGLGTQPPQPSWGRMLNEAQTHDVPGAAAGDLARRWRLRCRCSAST